MSTTEEQDFLDVVAADPEMTEAQKTACGCPLGGMIAARDYWGKLEALREAHAAIVAAAERVRRCYDAIETRHETMPAAMHALDVALRKGPGA